MPIFWRGLSWERGNNRLDYAKFNKSDASTPETTPTQTGSEKIRNRSDARARTRWLAVPRVRFHGRPRGPSHKTQKPVRWRCDRKLDNALCRLPRQMSRRSPVEKPPFWRQSLGRPGEPLAQISGYTVEVYLAAAAASRTTPASPLSRARYWS